MKMLTIIVRPEKFAEVVAALHDSGVTGLTVSEVRGQGFQKGTTQYYRGTEFRIDFLLKVKIETVIPDHRLEAVLAATMAAARTGQVGDGKIFISEVVDAVRVRTGERGEAALLPSQLPAGA